jgi:hypothetical protein
VPVAQTVVLCLCNSVSEERAAFIFMTERNHLPPKRWYTSRRLHGAKLQTSLSKLTSPWKPQIQYFYDTSVFVTVDSNM